MEQMEDWRRYYPEKYLEHPSLMLTVLQQHCLHHQRSDQGQPEDWMMAQPEDYLPDYHR
jgi:hypothetical protein